jgi:hypothetical protein
MNEKQIFISYSRKNRGFALRLYNNLLMEGYWVWMDVRLKEAMEWRPQIDDNIKRSNKCIVILSPDAIDSRWVNHEISMAHGRGQLIIPIRFQKHRTDQELPICVEPLQLFNMLEGEVDYDRALKKLKDILGEPLDIEQHLHEMLIHYRVSKMLLGEVAIRLYDKHKKEITWPEGQEALGLDMVAKSRRALHEYWEKYAELEKENSNFRGENDSLKRVIASSNAKVKLVFVFIVFLEILLLVYMYGVMF